MSLLLDRLGALRAYLNPVPGIWGYKFSNIPFLLQNYYFGIMFITLNYIFSIQLV